MNTRLMVLGLLRERPKHGYEIQKWLELSRTDLWADVLPGSIYHALRQMAKEGLIQVEATQQSGNRTRAVYAITEAGREALSRLLREGWQQTPSSFPQRLYTLLTFSDALPAKDVRRAIEKLIAELENQLATWDIGQEAKVGAGVLPSWGQAVFLNGREHLQTDLRLLKWLLENYGRGLGSPRSSPSFKREKRKP